MKVGVGLVGLAVIVALIASPMYRPVFLSGAGIAQGALIAAIAVGLVLTYQGSGVMNLANGAIAMYAAYTYAVLRGDGDLFLPPIPNPLAPVEGVVHRFGNTSFELPDVPTSISFGPNMQFWPALSITLFVCVALGALLHVAVFKRLSTAPPIAKVVASVGVFLTLQAVVLRRFGTTPMTVRPLPGVSKAKVDLGFLTLAQDQLVVAVLVIVCTVVLAIAYQRTRFGMATRAAAENPRAATFLGFSHNRLAMVNWVMSTLITGLLGVAVAAVNANVDPLVIPALIVPALTAGLVGGFRSFGLTTVASFLLGMQVPVIQTLGVREDWFPRAGTFAIPGVETLVPLTVLVFILFVRGRAQPGRGAETFELPVAPEPSDRSKNVVLPVVGLTTAVLALFVLSPPYRDALSTTLVGIILCLSVVVVTGYVGQLSLAPLTFAGIAGFVVSHLSSGLGWPFPLPMLGGAIAALAVGLIFAVPALRIRGTNLAIVTIALALACDRSIFANEDVNGGLERAIVNTPSAIQQSKSTSYTILGQFTAGDNLQPNPLTSIFCLVVTLIVCFIVINLRRSTSGRRMLAVRENERGAASSGVDVARMKRVAFGTSAAIAGLGGAVIAYRSGSAVPDRFTYDKSLLVFAAAYLGGLTSVSGAVVGGLLVPGGIVFTLLRESLGVDEQFTLLIGGAGLVLMAVLAPAGVTGRVRLAIGRRRRGTVGIEVSGATR